VNARFAWLLCASFALGATACSNAPAGSDGSLDGGFADGALEASADGSSDASPALPPSSCDPCVYDEQCGPGGQCDELDPVNAPSLRTCLAACAEVGASCSAHGVAGLCVDGTFGPVCRPSTSCIASARNAACPAAGCSGRFSRCALSPEPVCLSRCTTDLECENGFARCRPRMIQGGATELVCVPDDPVGADQCARRAVNDRGVGASCESAACAGASRCERGLVGGGGPFCTVDCAVDHDCGPNAHCSMLGGARACVPDDCSPFEPRAAQTMLDRALGAGMRNRSELFYSRTDLDAFPTHVTRDRFRLPIFNRVHRDWVAGARWARSVGPALDMRASTLSGAIASAGGLRADGDALSLSLPAAVTTSLSLPSAIAALDAQAGGTLTEAALTAALAGVPADLQAALAPIVVAMQQARAARDEGVRWPWSREERERLFDAAPSQILGGFVALNPRDGRDLGALLGGVVVAVRESVALGRTIESISWASFRDRMIAPVTIETSAGSIVLRGGGADTYEAAAHPAVALLVDLGGDDRYLAPIAANQSFDNAVSVSIDLSGADQYGYDVVAMGFLPSDREGRDTRSRTSRSRTFRQGSGRLGVAMLYDLGAGNDRYRSLRGAQGFGAMGVGALFDEGGDDQYEVEAAGQGAAVAGVGVLVDRAGVDRYTAWTFAQGFGYVRGVGVLFDGEGDDQYEAKETPVAYPSPQNPMVNTSFSQGGGFGRRADGVDNVNMSGGIGVLRDARGADRYRASIFGQATGYWGGMGLLLDGAGDDQYDARWYVQGGAAHFAYAALVDGGGRDVHNMAADRQNMCAGAGHDFSVGYLLADGAEGDVYNVPNLALGAGNANGAGFFVEAGGDDTYRAPSALTLGNAAYENLMDTGRLMRRTWGVFLDAQGADTYERAPLAPVQNDGAWTQRIHESAPNETGVGADGTAPAGL
jgi:hypothetical protein